MYFLKRWGKIIHVSRSAEGFHLGILVKMLSGQPLLNLILPWYIYKN